MHHLRLVIEADRVVGVPKPLHATKPDDAETERYEKRTCNDAMTDRAREAFVIWQGIQDVSRNESTAHKEYSGEDEHYQRKKPLFLEVLVHHFQIAGTQPDDHQVRIRCHFQPLVLVQMIFPVAVGQRPIDGKALDQSLVSGHQPAPIAILNSSISISISGYLP